jgi:hypothetical protein
MELVTRRVKSLLKRNREQDADTYDLFMERVIEAFLSTNLSAEQTKVAIALLTKEGYMA